MLASSAIRPRGAGLFGRGFQGGIVATPEQRAESERMSAMLGGQGRGHPEMMQNGLQLNPPQNMPMQPMPPQNAQPQAPRLSTGQRIAGIVGDALSGMAGGQAHFANSMEQRRQQHHEAMLAEADFGRRVKLSAMEREAEARAPQYFMSGGDRLRYDPVSGATDSIYDAPSDFDEYARSLGLEPGADGYAAALQDYVLRSSGPTATENDLRIEGARFDNRSRLEGQRQGNRLELRGTPTYRQANPAPRGAGRRPAGRSARSEPTAVNPTTGERLVLRNGAWVPAR